MLVRFVSDVFWNNCFVRGFCLEGISSGGDFVRGDSVWIDIWRGFCLKGILSEGLLSYFHYSSLFPFCWYGTCFKRKVHNITKWWLNDAGRPSFPVAFFLCSFFSWYSISTFDIYWNLNFLLDFRRMSFCFLQTKSQSLNDSAFNLWTIDV